MTNYDFSDAIGHTLRIVSIIWSILFYFGYGCVFEKKLGLSQIPVLALKLA